MRWTKLLAVVVLLTSTACTPWGTQDDLAAIDGWLTSSDFSGYLLAVRGSRVLIAEGYGYADRAADVANAGDVAYAIGSVTKPFTAIAVLQLAEEGLVALDDPARRHMPELPWQDITIRHLLTHRSGLWRDFGSDWAGRPNEDIVALTTALERVKDASPPARPGEEFGYSNIGYQVLAHMVERVSGVAFGEYLRTRVFEPAGMTRTFLHDAPTTRVALGYDGLGNDALPIADAKESALALAKPGAGGIVSTPDDLLAWTRALRAGVLLPRAVVAEAFRSHSPSGAYEYEGYGYGWEVGRHTNAVWHTGGAPGFTAGVYLDLDSDTTIIYTSNLELNSPPAGHARALIHDAQLQSRFGRLAAPALGLAAAAFVGAVLLLLTLVRRRVARPQRGRLVLGVVVPVATWLTAAATVQRELGRRGVPRAVLFVVAPGWKTVFVILAAAGLLVVAIVLYASTTRAARPRAG